MLFNEYLVAFFWVWVTGVRVGCMSGLPPNVDAALASLDQATYCRVMMNAYIRWRTKCAGLPWYKKTETWDFVRDLPDPSGPGYSYEKHLPCA